MEKKNGKKIAVALIIVFVVAIILVGSVLVLKKNNGTNENKTMNAKLLNDEEFEYVKAFESIPIYGNYEKKVIMVIQKNLM